MWNINCLKIAKPEPVYKMSSVENGVSGPCHFGHFSRPCHFRPLFYF